MNNIIRKIVNHLEQESICYEELCKTYDEQKTVLVKNEHKKLQALDEKFSTIYGKIIRLNKKREVLFNQLDPNIKKLSDVIKIAELENNPNIEKLKELNKAFAKYHKDLERKRYINYELLKNGISISDKRIGIIIEAVTPQGSYYDKKGRSKDIKNLPISTISEEV